MVYVTGDTHGDISFFKDPKLKKLTDEDILIVCGDFGFLWDRSDKEKKALQTLEKKKYTICFVDGAHENFDILNSYKDYRFKGGNAHKIAPNIFQLLRGEIYTFDKKTFFCMGGGESDDREMRTEGETWWKEEMPSREEMEQAIAALEQNHWRVDYVITHCAPRSVQTLLASWYENDPMVSFLDRVCSDLTFKRWFFGHYHVDKQVNEKFIALYNKVIPMEW